MTNDAYQLRCGVITNYEASTHGRIRNMKTKYILKQHKCLEGYCHTSLYINRLPKTLIVHPLIISTFKSNPKNLKHVNHIDMVRDNNHIDNLEWTTCSDNQKHAVLLVNIFQTNCLFGILL